MTYPIQYLSYSSISMYQLCPESWRRRYILHEQTPASLPLVFGSAVHSTIEAYLKRGGDLSELWQEHYAGQLQFEALDVDFGTETPESVAADGERILTARNVARFLAAIRGNYDPDGGSTMERRVELRVPGVPVPVIGYVDIITRDGVPGDFKTAAKMWARDRAENEMQPLVYLAALEQEGYHDHGWRFRHYVIAKGTPPQVRTFETRRTPEEVEQKLYPATRQVWTGICAGKFPKAIGSWKCCPKWCGYWRACRG